MPYKEFDFYVIKRKGYYYARFFDYFSKETICEKSVHMLARKVGKKFDGVVGGKTKDRQAEAIVREYQESTTTHKFNIPHLYEYIKDYWDYAGERVSMTNKKNPHQIGMTACYNQMHNYDKHLKDKFSEKETVTTVTNEMLNKIQDKLLTDSGLANATIDKIMKSVLEPLHYAYEKGIRDTDVKIDKLNTAGKERGILTVSQIAELMKVFQKWEDQGKYDDCPRLAIATAALTAMRQGEVRALQKQDIEIVNDIDSVVDIKHSFSRTEGLKQTKGKRARKTTIPTVVARSLIERAERNPFGEDFIFWDERYSTHVIDPKTLRSIFYEGLKSIGIKDSEREDKNIVFHSLRHGFVSYIRNQVSDSEFRLSVGHQDAKTTDQYTHQNYENMKQIADSTNKVFADVIDAV